MTTCRLYWVPTGVGSERVVGRQVRNLRTASGLSVGDMAAEIGIRRRSKTPRPSCSLSTLAGLANELDVPVTSLFCGVDSAREVVFTPVGHGAVIVGRGTHVGHHYELLGALRGQHKRLEPVPVTLTEASETLALIQQPGTELLCMLEGVMMYGHGGAEYTQRPGDSLLLDGAGPHGPNDLVRLPIRLLAITAYPDNHVE